MALWWLFCGDTAVVHLVALVWSMDFLPREGPIEFKGSRSHRHPGGLAWVVGRGAVPHREKARTCLQVIIYPVSIWHVMAHHGIVWHKHGIA